MKSRILIFLMALIGITSCTENYSNGERIGLITKFSEKGFWWKSWEGDLSVTQTGMNQSQNDFEFSLDNDLQMTEDYKRIKLTLDSAAEYGWKVKIKYHETLGKNWFSNRGETSHFITACEVLDKTPMQSIFNGKGNGEAGRVIDTIYVVIWDPSVKKFEK